MWKTKILHNISLYIHSALDFVFPRYCLCCRHCLSPGEELLCVKCLAKMPRIRHFSWENNEISRTFWGLIPIQRAAALFRYSRHSPYSRILFELKYHHQPEIGCVMGRMMAEELLPTGFFDDIDFIVPIPLSRRKERERGYNQSAWIAKGIAQITGLPVDTTSVARILSNPSQTRLSEHQRRSNVRNIFSVRRPEQLENRHILLVDDVITTGATMLSCAETIAGTCRVQISILSLAWAGHS